jgi:DNA repair exonuclease SbcCD ATPase subunit
MDCYSRTEQVATDAADVIYLDDDRQNANVILGLSFDFARVDAQLLASQGSPGSQTAGTGPNKYQSLVAAAQSADAEVRETQSELDAAKKKLQSARPSNRRKLSSKVEELQSELDLAQTRSTTLHNLLQFVTGTSGTGSNLESQIEELEHSVPELEAVSVKGGRAQTSRSPSGSGIQPANRRPQPSGIIDLIEDLFSLSHKTGVIERRIRSTDELANHSQRLRAPLIADLTNAAQQGEQAAKQADTSDPSQLQKLKQQLDALNSGFKQVCTVVLPLSKQEVLFDLYRGNLARWRSVVKSDYSADLKRLFLRLVIFGAVLAVLITLARCGVVRFFITFTIPGGDISSCCFAALFFGSRLESRSLSLWPQSLVRWPPSPV